MTEPKPIQKLQTLGSNVPVRNCIVYVLRNQDGSVCGRVANLPNIQLSASTERDLLGKIVKEFKRAVQTYSQDESGVPWIEPPMSIEPGEQMRMIPVHW